MRSDDVCALQISLTYAAVAVAVKSSSSAQRYIYKIQKKKEWNLNEKTANFCYEFVYFIVLKMDRIFEYLFLMRDQAQVEKHSKQVTHKHKFGCFSLYYCVRVRVRVSFAFSQ